MDFAFFEGLTRDEGREFLGAFLRAEGVAVRGMLSAAEAEAGIRGDFTVESISPVLRWAIQKIQTVPQAPDPSLPTWIREGDSYARGLLGLDEPSRILTLRCAFYLGESFVRTYADLEWGVGDPEIAERNQPVVTGFADGIEMSPMLVCQNLFLRVCVDRAPPEQVDRAVAFWSARAA